MMKSSVNVGGLDAYDALLEVHERPRNWQMSFKPFDRTGK